MLKCFYQNLPVPRLVLPVIAIFFVFWPSVFAASINGGPALKSLPDENQDYIPADLVKRVSNPKDLFLRSHAAVVFDERDDQIIFQRGSHRKMAIASITKLMTAMVIIDANLDMDEPITIVKADRDTIRYSKTRLPIGSTLTREDMLLMALVASENRAAFALARTYPGGTKEFIKAMNDKARYLGLRNTKFADAAGLRKENVSTAQELVKMVRVAAQYTLIREFTTIVKDVIIDDRTGKTIRIWNTNRLMRKADWEIYLSKTGFTSDAGNCLVMKVKMGDRPLIIVLLNSWGKLSKYGDSNRIKHWIRNAEAKVRKLNLI
jgi:D-alanyl-D-alanine endopeptidase (penicillin-binding protein 7)